MEGPVGELHLVVMQKHPDLGSSSCGLPKGQRGGMVCADGSTGGRGARPGGSGAAGGSGASSQAGFVCGGGCSSGPDLGLPS